VNRFFVVTLNNIKIILKWRLTLNKKMLRTALIISILVNIALLSALGKILVNKGGLSYLSQKLNAPKKNDTLFVETTYYKTKRSIHEKIPGDSNAIIFLGNSITEYAEWHEIFGNPKVKNRGISGDKIAGVKNRIANLTSQKPAKIFLMLGTNDLGEGRSIPDILYDYEALVQFIQNASPRTQIFLQSILPTYGDATRNNKDIIKLNAGIQKISKKYHLIYINLFDKLKTAENELDKRYSFDGLHINGDGYIVWKKEIETYIED
jgi:lysophospholipase L1-like esterase